MSDVERPELAVGLINTQIFTSPHASPDLDPEPKIVAYLKAAKHSILFSAYSFTLVEVAAAIVAQHVAGLSVRGVMDAAQYRGTNSQGPVLVAAGVDIRLWGTQYALNHDKMLIIDGDVVVNGSYNFTTSAEKSNKECCEIKTGIQVSRIMAPTYAAAIEDVYSKGHVPA